MAEASRKIRVTEQTFYRWRAEYGGLRIDQARRLKRSGIDNARLRRGETSERLPSAAVHRACAGGVGRLQAASLRGTKGTEVDTALCVSGCRG